MARAAEVEPIGDTREMILKAALRAFAEKGYDGATTRDIATRAGVNHGLIPYYFGDKNRLWRSAVDLAFDELRVELDAVTQDSRSVDERVRASLAIRSFARFIARKPEFVCLMHEEGKRKGPRMRWLVDRHVKPIFESVVALLESAQERGFLPADIPAIHFHYILVGAVTFIFHQAEECRRVTGLDPYDEGVAEEHARAVEYLLFRNHIEENET